MDRFDFFGGDFPPPIYTVSNGTGKISPLFLRRVDGSKAEIKGGDLLEGRFYRIVYERGDWVASEEPQVDCDE